MKSSCSAFVAAPARLAFAISAGLLLTASALAAQDQRPGEAETPGAPQDGVIKPSDSPHLRPPEFLQDLEPIVPYSGPRGVPVDDPTATIIYDVASGTETVLPSANDRSDAALDGVRTSEGFEGLAPPVAPKSGLGPDSVIGTDDRSRITATGSFPWRTVVRLAVQWSDGTGGVCSGSIISPYHVLTAGHCVFDFGDTDDWADSIQVFPGLNDAQMPYNFAWVTRFHSYTGWTGSGQSEHDWAVIALDRSIGNSTGWMGRQTAAAGNGIYTGVLNVSGYPATPNANATCPSWANCQYWDSDSGDDSDDFNHWYWMDTSGGMSGGPVWRYTSDPAARFILTTHTCGTGGCGVGSSGGANHGTRLNQDKYDRIPTWISDDDDIEPNDRADLIDDGEAFSGFSPTVVRGGQSFSSWSDVRNIGTANSGSFHVSYYASTNTTISASDYLLGHDFTSSIAPFTWADSSLNVSFSSSIPDGTYYVGWIVDGLGAVAEFNEGNNSAFVSDQTLVVCQRAASPNLLSPADNSLSPTTMPSFDWGSVAAADTYRFQLDDDPGFGSPEIDQTTSLSSYAVSAPLTAPRYFWRVRSDKSCGTEGLWTGTRSVILEGSVFSDEFEN